MKHGEMTPHSSSYTVSVLRYSECPGNIVVRNLPEESAS